MPITLDSLRAHVLAQQPGFYYEPRAYWGTIPVEEDDDPDLPAKVVSGEISLDSDDFYNSSKYPVVLTDMTILPRVGAGSGINPQGHLENILVRLVVSGNQAISRSPIPLSMLLGRSFEPPLAAFAMVEPPLGLLSYDTPTKGPIWNTSQWNFHHPLVLPKDGAVEYALGAMASGVTFNNDTVPNTPAYMAFTETGDSGAAFFKGNSRVHSVETLKAIAKESAPWGYGCGLQASNTTQAFDPAATIYATQFRRQNVTADGSTLLNGVSITFNQREWFSNPDWEGDPPVGPIASGVPTKARTSGCGTGEYWWREGAPVSLVSPTRTPALVGKLPMPILLQPGDGIDVSFMGGSGLISTSPLGISLTGFAAVEA